ncbi:unnamed protein product, partial [Lymnaea stagnalis]
SGYTFFWGGWGSEERRQAGVGFAVKSSLNGMMAGWLHYQGESAMRSWERRRDKSVKKTNNSLTIISYSAPPPTMTNTDEV